MTTFGGPDDQPGDTLSGEALFDKHGDLTGLRSETGDIFDIYGDHLERARQYASELRVISGDSISLQVVEEVGGKRYVRVTKN